MKLPLDVRGVFGLFRLMKGFPRAVVVGLTFGYWGIQLLITEDLVSSFSWLLCLENWVSIYAIAIGSFRVSLIWVNFLLIMLLGVLESDLLYPMLLIARLGSKPAWQLSSLLLENLLSSTYWASLAIFCFTQLELLSVDTSDAFLVYWCWPFDVFCI